MMGIGHTFFRVRSEHKGQSRMASVWKSHLAFTRPLRFPRPTALPLSS